MVITNNMRRMNKTTLRNNVSSILRGNEGTSLVLVSIIAILIITGVVILRMTTTSLWATADKQYGQDQAYVLATSMGTTVDNLITDHIIVLTDYNDPNGTVIVSHNPEGINDAHVTATVFPSGSGYIVKVQANVGDAVYVYTAHYSRAGNSNNFMRQIV